MRLIQSVLAATVVNIPHLLLSVESVSEHYWCSEGYSLLLAGAVDRYIDWLSPTGFVDVSLRFARRRREEGGRGCGGRVRFV